MELVERSVLPRHKVCGEFISPEILDALDRLGVTAKFQECGPARIDYVTLHLGSRSKTSPLPRDAYGLSRFAFDEILHAAARRHSGRLTGPPAVVVEATGRDTSGAPPKGERLFGFKAHFEGPQTSGVELYFFDGCYVGLNAIERGWTNVCGLGPEHALQKFEIDTVVRRSGVLWERLRPMNRVMDWLFVGPLVFRNRLRANLDQGRWPAGDSLSFVDPFTGSGLLSAVLTGELAGKYAAEGRSVDEYAAACRKLLGRQFAFSSFLRRIAGTPMAARLMPFIPTSILFHLTRPAT